jgi:O-antigen biosynthesis protein
MTKGLLGSGSKIRYYSAFVLSGINVIIYQGWGSFWRRFRNKVRKWSNRRTHPERFYQLWIKNNEPKPETLAKQKQYSSAFQYCPKISLLTWVPVCQPELFTLALNSIVNQTYANWELCIAVSNPENPQIKHQLQEYADRDSRIRVISFTESKPIPPNYFQSWSAAGGDFVGLIEPYDELAPFALYSVVCALNDQPQWDYIYSDEDIVNGEKKRANPFFKPDWSPDLLLSYMYTGRFSVYRKSLVEALGGFRPEFGSSQDYDLTLRITEKTNRIYHIPRILYHRRLEQNTIIGILPRNVESTRESDQRVLSAYLTRNNIQGQVYDGIWPGSFRVHREICSNPLVSIIIPTKNHVELLKHCLESIAKFTAYPNYEILIVDNQSTQTPELTKYYSEIRQQPQREIIKYDRPFNFAALNNFAVAQTRGKHLLFLNDDTEIASAEWLSALLEHSERPEVGAVGAKLLYPDGSIQHCGMVLGTGEFHGLVYLRNPDSPGYFGRVSSINNYSAVSGACVMVRKEVFKEIGGFDENLAVSCNDMDLCLRIRERGYLIVYTPYARLYHLESYTRGYTLTREKLAIYAREYHHFRQRWQAVIEHGDPYYNPNLSLENPDFSLGKISRSKTARC